MAGLKVRPRSITEDLNFGYRLDDFQRQIWIVNDLYVDDAAMAVDTPMSMPMPMILDA